MLNKEDIPMIGIIPAIGKGQVNYCRENPLSFRYLLMIAHHLPFTPCKVSRSASK
jgi:hypothetical protein